MRWAGRTYRPRPTLSWNGESTFIQLSAGAQSHDRFDSQTLLLDGTYIARQIHGARVYAAI